MTRAGFAVALAAGLWAGPAQTETLVVLNKAEATASLLDPATGAVVATLPTGEGPHEAAASPDGRFVLVANYGGEQDGHSLTLVDVAAARVAKTIELGDYSRPHGLRFLDARRAVVTAERQQALLIVDVEAGRVEAAVTTGQETSHMVAVTPDGARAFVANIGSGTVTAVDLAARAVLRQIPTGKGAEGIDVTPDGSEVWVANREADTVSVIDAATLEVLASLPAAAFPIRVKLTPDGRHALVSCARSGDVAVFDVATRRELRRIPMDLKAADSEGRLFGERFGSSSVPIGIVVPPDGRRGFVAHAQADVVSVLDLEKWAVARLLKAGREPDGMAWTPVSAQSR